MIDYDTNRAPYKSAGVWDRTVRFVRASEKLRARGADRADLVASERGGVAVLQDQTSPDRWEQL